MHDMTDWAIAQGERADHWFVTWLGGAVFLVALLVAIAVLSRGDD